MKISSRQILKVAGEAEAKRSSGLNFDYKYSQSKIMNFLKLAEVFGAEAVVYHGSRSPPEEFLNILRTEDFKPGKSGGGSYGKGLYTVYNLDPSKEGGVDYGSYIYKLKVNLYGFISFNPDITQKIYGKDLVPSEQYRLSGTDRTILSSLKDLDSRYGEMPSSVVAVEASKFLRGKVKGIIYTVETDGDCVAIYDAGTVIPLGWKLIEESNWKSFGEDSKSFVGRGIAGNFKEGIYGDSHTPELNPRFINFLETLSSEDLKDPRLSVRIKTLIERVARENPKYFLENFSEKPWAAPYMDSAAKACFEKNPIGFLENFSEKPWAESYIDTAAEICVRKDPGDFLENFSEKPWAARYIDVAAKAHAEKDPYNFLLRFSEEDWAKKPVESIGGMTWIEFAQRRLPESKPCVLLSYYAEDDWVNERLDSLGGKTWLEVAAEACAKKEKPFDFLHDFSEKHWANERLDSLGGRTWLEVTAKTFAEEDPYYFLINFSEKPWAESYIDSAAKASAEKNPTGFLKNFFEKPWAAPYIDDAAKAYAEGDPGSFLNHFSKKPWANKRVESTGGMTWIEFAAMKFAEKNPFDFLNLFSAKPWAKKRVESLGGMTLIEFAERKYWDDEDNEWQTNASQNPINAKLTKLAKALKSLGLHDDCRIIKSLNRN